MSTPGVLRGGINKASGSTLRLLQLTDTHLMGEPGGRLLNVDTDRSLAAVVALASRSAAADAVLVTGDIAGASSVSAYYRLERALAPLNAASFWLPGNHDDAHACRSELGQHFLRQISFPHWHIVMLDSQVTDKVHGSLSDDELTALAVAIETANAGHKHLLVALHHPLWPVGCAWLDPQRVANASAMADCLAAASNAVLVISGHVHQANDLTRDGVRYLTTPSTCVQFAKNAVEFKVDDVGPGFRWLELQADGTVSTGVERVTDIRFPVDLDSQGYL